MVKVIVIVKGGCVTDVYSTDSTLDVKILDYDDKNQADEGSKELKQLESLEADCKQMFPIY